MRSRHVVIRNSIPMLPRHVRLQFDVLRQKFVVLAPERVLWPDEPSVAILEKCNGERPLGQIAEQLAQEFNADQAVVEADVTEFVQDWGDKRLMQFENNE